VVKEVIEGGGMNGKSSDNSVYIYDLYNIDTIYTACGSSD